MWGQPPSAVRSSEARRPLRCSRCIPPRLRVNSLLGFLERHAHHMPAITALLHTRNDALRLGRALETLLPCDEIVVVDHGTDYAARRIAREYGARVVSAKANITPSQCLHLARHDWILCLEPRESLTETLAASLFEWKAEWKPKAQSQQPIAFSFLLREETPNGWQTNPTPQTRLVPRSWSHWNGMLPASEASAITLEGALLRFILP